MMHKLGKAKKDFQRSMRMQLKLKSSTVMCNGIGLRYDAIPQQLLNLLGTVILPRGEYIPRP